MSLELLVDAHVGGTLYSRLDSDFRIVRVVDVLHPDAPDIDIWRYAVDNDLIVFTNDPDFVNGSANPNNGTHPGIIRYKGRNWKKIHQAVLVIDSHYTQAQIADNSLELFVPGHWC